MLPKRYKWDMLVQGNGFQSVVIKKPILMLLSVVLDTFIVVFSTELPMSVLCSDYFSIQVKEVINDDVGINEHLFKLKTPLSSSETTWNQLNALKPLSNHIFTYYSSSPPPTSSSFSSSRHNVSTCSPS